MADVGTDRVRALSFGEVADEYDRWRPAYPAAAVDWLAPAAPARVADVGAGTGKLTALLLARGLTVEAVEPDPRMLAVLERNHAEVHAHSSESTSIPVSDGSLDAVLVADAWQWFDPEPTILELRRVLRPGGWLGLVWNVSATPKEPWELELAGESAPGVEPDPEERLARARRQMWYFPADELEIGRFSWTQELTPEHRAAAWATTSMAIALTPDERTKRVAAHRAEFQRICDAAGRSSMPVRSVASCLRWTPGRTSGIADR